MSALIFLYHLCPCSHICMIGCITLMHKYLLVRVFLHSHSEMRNPLYNSAPLTAEESMYTTYLYAIKNKLSYQATAQLLDLMRIHLPAPNSYPRSFYALKKHVSGMATLTLKKFCSTCLGEVPKENKHCNRRECKHSALCHYALLPFQEHLEAIYSGVYIYNLF